MTNTTKTATKKTTTIYRAYLTWDAETRTHTKVAVAQVQAQLTPKGAKLDERHEAWGHLMLIATADVHLSRGAALRAMQDQHAAEAARLLARAAKAQAIADAAQAIADAEEVAEAVAGALAQVQS